MCAELFYGTIVKGGEDAFTVVLTDASGWASEAASWTWKLLLGKWATRTTLAVALTASAAVISTTTNADDTMTLTFPITPIQSAALDASKYAVECEATEDDGTEHYYDAVNGYLKVREPEGGG